uniref:Carboxypeptidase regulatory-like domain-containing protein n=1 Tax=Solibacter usitatus (strain Ellin6076) TaxID=234267 RepID=Q01VM0_SOLUE
MRAALLYLLVPVAAWGCKCQLTMSACNEAATTDVIFIGTVEAIEPSFLDSWNAAQRGALATLNEEAARAEKDHSAAGFTKLRDAYLKVFPDLPEEHKKRLSAAKSAEQLNDLFYWILDHGKRIRLRVKTVFRGKDLDDDDEGSTVEVWTAFGDCGFAFQVGETYLVYADDDEESDVMTTGACTRTRRVSDAGDDLAYLYFVKQDEDRAGRIEGFVTTDLLYQRQLDASHYSDHIASPVAGAVVELKSSATPRYAAADEKGHFVFDGLPAGAFTVSAFTPAFPAETRLLAGPKEVRLGKGACGFQVLVAPGSGGK